MHDNKGIFDSCFNQIRMYHSVIQMFNKSSDVLISAISTLSAGLCLYNIQNIIEEEANILNVSLGIGSVAVWLISSGYRLKKLPQEYPEYQKETKIERAACELVKAAIGTNVVRYTYEIIDNARYLNLIPLLLESATGYWVCLAQHHEIHDETTGSIIPWRERRYVNLSTTQDNLLWIIRRSFATLWGFSVSDGGKYLTSTISTLFVYGIPIVWGIQYCVTKSRKYRDFVHSPVRAALREFQLFCALLTLGISIAQVTSLNFNDPWSNFVLCCASSTLFIIHEKRATTEYGTVEIDQENRTKTSSTILKVFLNTLRIFRSFPELLITAMGALSFGFFLEKLKDLLIADEFNNTVFGMLIGGSLAWLISLPINSRYLQQYLIYQREYRIETVAREMIKISAGAQVFMSFIRHYNSRTYANMPTLLLFSAVPYVVSCGHYHELSDSTNYTVFPWKEKRVANNSTLAKKLSWLFDRCLDFYLSLTIKDQFISDNPLMRPFNGWGQFLYIILISRKIVFSSCFAIHIGEEIFGDFAMKFENLIRLLARRIMLFTAVGACSFATYDMVQAIREENLVQTTKWSDGIYLVQALGYATLFCTHEYGRDREPLEDFDLLQQFPPESNLPDSLIPPEESDSTRENLVKCQQFP
jgi:hypothetical protein